MSLFLSYYVMQHPDVRWDWLRAVITQLLTKPAYVWLCELSCLLMHI